MVRLLASARARAAGDPPRLWSRGEWALVAVRVTALVAFPLVAVPVGIRNVLAEPDVWPPVPFWAVLAAVPAGALLVARADAQPPVELRQQAGLLAVLLAVLHGVLALAEPQYLVVVALAGCGLALGALLPRTVPGRAPGGPRRPPGPEGTPHR